MGKESQAYSDVGQDRRSKVIFRLLLIVNTLIVLVPIWTVRYPGLADYPNHLARCYMIYHYDDVRIFHEKYRLLSEPVPNIACDLVIPVFLNFFDPFVSGKLFLTLSALMFSLGIYLLSVTVSKRGDWIAALMPFLFYCSQFFWGLINYMFGVALFLIAFALWYRWRNELNWWKVSSTALLTTMLYLAHLSAYVFMGVGCFSVLAVDAMCKKRAPSRWWLSLIPLVPGLLLYFGYMHGSGKVESWRELYWGGPGEKAVGLLSPFITYDYWLDAIGIAIASFAVICFLLRRKLQTIDQPLFFTAIIFVLLYFACPSGLFGSWGADVRFIIPGLILFLVSLHLTASRRLSRTLFLLELAVLIARVVFVEVRWQQNSGEIAADVELMTKVKSQSAICPVYDNLDVFSAKQRRLFNTITSYAVILRNVYDVKTFESPGRFMLRNPEHLPKVGELALASQAGWDSLFSQVDYFWAYRPMPKFKDELRTHCILMGTAPNSELWVRKDLAPH
jgi:hypothetical protein